MRGAIQPKRDKIVADAADAVRGTTMRPVMSRKGFYENMGRKAVMPIITITMMMTMMIMMLKRLKVMAMVMTGARRERKHTAYR
jgi:hypothetical protein